MINNEFRQYVYERCEVALNENNEYKRLEDELAVAENEKSIKDICNLAELTQSKAEELCYIKGYLDALQLIMNSK